MHAAIHSHVTPLRRISGLRGASFPFLGREWPSSSGAAWHPRSTAHWHLFLPTCAITAHRVQSSTMVRADRLRPILLGVMGRNLRPVMTPAACMLKPLQHGSGWRLRSASVPDLAAKGASWIHRWRSMTAMVSRMHAQAAGWVPAPASAWAALASSFSNAQLCTGAQVLSQVCLSAPYTCCHLYYLCSLLTCAQL